MRTRTEDAQYMNAWMPEVTTALGTPTRGRSMRTEEIKARIEAMFADGPVPAPGESHEGTKA
jgi:hypothetical protein